MNEHELRTYFRIEKINEDERIVEASISSEYPYHRPGQGDEVLIHENASIDLSRGPELPVLIGHDWKPENVGVAYNFRLKGKKLYATLKFGFGKRASDIWTDVKAGILKFISISYDVLKKTKPDSTGKYYVTKWRPLEVSLVSVAADPTVGIGRSRSNDRTQEFEDYFSVSKGNKKMTRKEIKEKNDRELQERIDRDNRFWSQGVEFKSLAEQFRAVKNFAEIGRDDPRLRSSGLNEIVGSEGGFLLQSDFTQKLLNGPDTTEIWKRCFQVKLSEKFNSIMLPKFHEDSRAEGSFLGGIRFYWPEQGEAGTYSHFKVSGNRLSFEKCVALIPYTDELASDSQAFDTVIGKAAQIALNYVIEQKIIRGTGVGEPLGILNAGCTLVQAKESGQNADTINAANVENMMTHSSNIYDSLWITHKETLPQLSKLAIEVGTGGGASPIFRFRSGGERYHKLAGLDVLFSDHASPLGDRGDLILASLSDYVAVYKEFKKAVSIHLLFDTDEDVFRLIFRWNGQPTWSKPVTPAQGSTQIAPFVTLAERS